MHIWLGMCNDWHDPCDDAHCTSVLVLGVQGVPRLQAIVRRLDALRILELDGRGAAESTPSR